MSEIWIVQGSTGEYSDHMEWPVRAFRSQQKAERLVVEAQARANEIYEPYAEYYLIPKEARVNEFDPGMKFDYTGTHYTCYSVELIED